MNWIIKMLGGYTREEYTDLQARYDAIPAVWTAAVAALASQGKVTIIEGPAQVLNPHIEGALIVAPRSAAHLIGAYSEGQFLPVDSQNRIH